MFKYRNYFGFAGRQEILYFKSFTSEIHFGCNEKIVRSEKLAQMVSREQAKTSKTAGDHWTNFISTQSTNNCEQRPYKYPAVAIESVMGAWQGAHLIRDKQTNKCDTKGNLFYSEGKLSEGTENI